jgi:hypothetical protein
MTRLLSIVLLTSLLGLAAPGAAVVDVEAGQAIPMSQMGSDAGSSMTDKDCGACAAGCACTSAHALQAPGTETSWPPVGRHSLQFSDQIRAPQTAPPKRSFM